MEEGYLQPLDLDQVPACDDVFDFLKADYFEQDGEVYGIPEFGQTPLAVNTDIVEQDVTALVTSGRTARRRRRWSRRRAATGPVPKRRERRAAQRRHVPTTWTSIRSGRPHRPTGTDFRALERRRRVEQLLRSDDVGVQPVGTTSIQSMQSDGSRRAGLPR